MAEWWRWRMGRMRTRVRVAIVIVMTPFAAIAQPAALHGFDTSCHPEPGAISELGFATTSRSFFAAYRAPQRRRNPLKIDLDPILGEIVTYFRAKGLRVSKLNDGTKPVALSATVRIGRDLPNLQLHLGDKTPENLGAFYASHSGVRWAVIWPVDSFTLRIEGGKDSEFGYLAIAGLHWRHPTRPIAVGIGLPARMKRAYGRFGAVFQLRMKLN